MEEKTRKKDTRWMVTVALMAAIVILLANTPLGMIQLPFIKATTVHIPVMLGAVVLGPTAGLILGATFGVCSMISNTMAPTLMSFAFSPFLSNTGVVGALQAIWISVGCRASFGWIAGMIWKGLQKIPVEKTITLAVLGFTGSILHTILVLGSIYLLMADQYAQTQGIAVSAVFGLIMGTVTASGIPEAIAASILVAVIGRILIKVYQMIGLNR